MGSWSEQQEVKKEVKEKEKTSRETLGKFFYDLAKISFTALVVGLHAFLLKYAESKDSSMSELARQKTLLPHITSLLFHLKPF